VFSLLLKNHCVQAVRRILHALNSFFYLTLDKQEECAIILHMLNRSRSQRMEPDERQGQIIKIAATHFARDGYDGASMSGIAADAGVTRALLYHYFPGKSPLLEAVLRQESEALYAATSPDSKRSPTENIRAALRAYIEHFAPRKDRTLNLHMQAEGVSALVGRMIKANHVIQTERIMATLDLKPDLLVRSSVSGWLDFVTTVVKEVADCPDVTQESVIEVCLRTLQAATGIPIE
jgi:AcrR family transcriptional regulator